MKNILKNISHDLVKFIRESDLVQFGQMFKFKDYHGILYFLSAQTPPIEHADEHDDYFLALNI